VYVPPLLLEVHTTPHTSHLQDTPTNQEVVTWKMADLQGSLQEPPGDLAVYSGSTKAAFHRMACFFHT